MSKRKYYYDYDFYNMVSDEELTIISHFPTRQETINSACGPNAILMILNYYKDQRFTEKDVCDSVYCRLNYGTKIKDVVDFFRDNNYIVETSIEKNKNVNGRVFDYMEEFYQFVIDNLSKGYPILVESVYYGGHYQVIIGYDKRNQKNFYDDILILADSSDETDGNPDGYVYISAFKFFTMWFDDRYFPVEHRIQPFVVVKKRVF